ncbi:uncharacterized protein LY79DRAFT_95166 [Colletotrichum navitas]|uniref:Uncharacterized protein n=1 Tax=Colletotrichum navitas TaxID=681940 RepID=A0AAD8Q4T6_9PEZI|nr:uncharacterized protein LY79DRAFT_95166 [Colletotrichum navitas]KAK1595876.1 hypothetical protein LY79DRAFT_95166 [Colletotrichum navitas]
MVVIEAFVCDCGRAVRCRVCMLRRCKKTAGVPAGCAGKLLCESGGRRVVCLVSPAGEGSQWVHAKITEAGAASHPRRVLLLAVRMVSLRRRPEGGTAGDPKGRVTLHLFFALHFHYETQSLRTYEIHTQQLYAYCLGSGNPPSIHHPLSILTSPGSRRQAGSIGRSAL